MIDSTENFVHMSNRNQWCKNGIFRKIRFNFLHYTSVVELLLYCWPTGHLKKNVTPRWPLPTKWCIKQQIHKI